jgi:hypothetical protein
MTLHCAGFFLTEISFCVILETPTTLNGVTMYSKAEYFANQAVYTLQMPSAEAIRYIRRNAGVGLEEAESVFRSVIVFHKQK